MRRARVVVAALAVGTGSQSWSNPSPTPTPRPHQEGRRTWITNVTIVSPESLGHIVRGNVLILDGRIARVDRNPVADDTSGATVISGEGKYLIPGLIDSHVHVTLVPGMNADQVAAHPGIVRQYFQQLPRSYLYYGYTTLVDLGVAVDHDQLDRLRNAPLHPDVYTCGDALVLLNGYPMSFYVPVRLSLFPNFIVDPHQTPLLPPGYDLKDHTPVAAIGAVKRAGGICVKTFFERGFGKNANLPVIDRRLMAEIRDEAHRSGLPVFLHANSLEAQAFGVEGRVDVLAHGMWQWGDLDTSAQLPPRIAVLLDRIASEGVGYQPTIQVIFAQRAYFDSSYLDMPAIPRIIPEAMLAWFRSADGHSFKDTLSGDAPAADALMLRAYDRGPLRRVRDVVAYLARRHAHFLFGTDTPSMPSYGNLPGLNGYLEMRQLRSAGLSLEQILRAATIDNSRLLRIDSLVGTIEPGKTANLVLLNRSPLESVDAYDSIVAVWVHGKPIPREELAAR